MTIDIATLANRTPLFRGIGDRQVPTMLMWGTDDQVTPITGMDAARTLLRPAQTHVIDCGHMAPYERPADVAELLATFINYHSDRITS